MEDKKNQLKELKAIAYDLSTTIATTQNQLTQVNNAIAQVSQEIEHSKEPQTKEDKPIKKWIKRVKGIGNKEQPVA